MQSNWIKKGNLINPQLPEKEQLLIKIEDNRRTVARQIQELMSVYPEQMTDELWAVWQTHRHLLEGHGRYVRPHSELPRK